MELMRISGLEHLGGEDLRHAESLYCLSTFESSVMDACVAALRLIYDSPLSAEGMELDAFLKYLEKDWDLGQHFARHQQALDLAKSVPKEYH